MAKQLLGKEVTAALNEEDRKSTRLNSSHHGIGDCGVWV